MCWSQKTGGDGASQRSGQLVVCLVGDGLQPLVGAALAGDLDGQMGEPAVWGGAVPVLHLRRDVDHIPRTQGPGRLAPFLVVALAGQTEQYLPAVCFTAILNTSYSREKVMEIVPFPSFSLRSVGSSILASLVKFQELVP